MNQIKGRKTVHEFSRYSIYVLIFAITLALCACSNPAGSSNPAPPVNAVPPVINVQPQNAVYYRYDTAAALTAVAKTSDNGVLSYQWYRHTADSNEGGNVVINGNNQSYTPSTDSAGIFYYYVVVTNTIPNNGDGGKKTASTTSEPARVVVNDPLNAAMPLITVHPLNNFYERGVSADPLTVEAEITDNGSLSYQWYSNTQENIGGAQSLDEAIGGKSKSYTPSTASIGTLYYYVVVTNTNISVDGNKTAAATSNIAAITVSPPFVPVSDIVATVPAAIYRGDPLILSGTAMPANATNRTVVWSVISQGTTGAVITGSTLNTTGGGTLVIRASVPNGEGPGIDYFRDFTIEVLAPVTDITGVPESAIVGTPLTLIGTVIPGYAVNRNIEWSISPLDNGTTGALIIGNELTATNTGEVKVRATVANGLIDGDYTQDFTITIKNEGAAVTLSLDNFTMTDEGEGVFLVDGVQPIVLNKSAGDSRVIQTQGLTITAWYVGSIPLGTGNTITLNASNFNPGTYTLTVIFIKEDKPWLGSISFKVE